MNDFKTQFNEALSSRGISSAKLSELTGVPERYIEFMRIGNLDPLPPAPYVRGYLAKIASVMGTNSEELWLAYRQELPAKTSGANDKLPANRFSFRKIGKGKIGLAAVGLAVLLYGLFRFNDIIGKPILVIENPGSATLVLNTNHLVVNGRIKPGDKLTINNESEAVDSDGNFKKDIELFPGVNILEFRARHSLGREIGETKKIIYEPNNGASKNNGAVSNATTTSSTSPSQILPGKTLGR